MITGQASITTAVEATRLGAFDYIQKTTDREKTFIAINNAIEIWAA
jgi:ActR/RegA family two-component response regulator